MAEIPSYEVYTRQKLSSDPTPLKKRRLAFRTFRESELKNLNEVLHDADIELQGPVNYIIS